MWTRLLDFFGLRGGTPMANWWRHLLLALVFGLLLLPLAIWCIGRVTLGAYARGGPFSLYADYFRGLVHGDSTFWVVLIGPYVAWLLLRLALFSYAKTK